jgi:hypothetical protein
VRSTHPGSVVGGKRGACLPGLVGGLSSLRKVKRLKKATIRHDSSATLTWLGEALEYARGRNQAKLVGHLEEVLDDAVFEMEMAARR